MRPRVGFTLIEVMVAVAILALALSSTAFLLAGAFGTYRQQGQQMNLFHMTHDKFEILTSTPYSALHNDLDTGRQPNDPPRPDLLPDHDFIKTAGGDATVHYRLVPTEPNSDVYKLERPLFGQIQYTSSRFAMINAIDATLRLQYWDPIFDAPSMTDRGLIRANLVLKDQNGSSDRSTKYFAR